MKKKILILTSIYPGENIPKSFTPVVHYFAREWVKDGYDVRVVHNLTYYHKLFYLLSSFFSKTISSYTGTNIPSNRIVKKEKYTLDHVNVFRLPIYKKIPYTRYSKSVIDKQVVEILNALKNDSFSPDIILGHWCNPQLEIINILKSTYQNSTFGLTMHSSGKAILRLYPKCFNKLIMNIDIWGFRSKTLKNKFENLFGVQSNSFLCFSGVPQSSLICKQEKKFDSRLTSFLYVGSLIKRKYPNKIIQALMSVYSNEAFTLNYVGIGNEEKSLKKNIEKYKLQNNVFLNGFISREEVKNLMIFSECFIMISKDEAYGLVYLEAMAAGCITIASRQEGFDGVIINGVNGFLCEAGNEVELSEIIIHINSLSLAEKITISNNAKHTASGLSDYQAAKKYIKNFEF